MRTGRVVHLAILIGAVLLARPAAAEPVPLTLDAAVRGAIERNLDLRVQTFTPAIAETGVSRARAIYDTRLSGLVDHWETNDPADPAPSFVTRTRYFDANLSAAQLLPTGATATAAFNNKWYRDNLGTLSSRSARSSLSLSLSQPVLQGFGRTVTEKDITTASDASEQALADWRSAALTTAGKARDAYYALIKARSNLETRKASLAAARELHAENGARVKAGILAAVELLDSEFGVSQRERDLLASEKAVLDAIDTLAVVIQSPRGAELAPVDPFPGEAVSETEERAMETARKNRPDIVRSRIALRDQEFLVGVARNAALPLVNLTGSASTSGLSTSYGSAVGDAGSGRYPDWSVGLQFSYPLGNRAAESDLAANRLKARQAAISLRSVEENAALEIRTALRDLDTKRKQIDVGTREVALGEARLDSFIERQKVGLARTKDVLDAETNLTQAREDLAGARADYQSAATTLWKATGELLDRHGIRIADADVQKQAWKELR